MSEVVSCLLSLFGLALITNVLGILQLESNLRRLALSAEWVKPVDSVATLGSASHVMTSSLRVSSKHVIGGKHGRSSDLLPNPSSKAATGLGLFWWRGGRLSRELFKWKVLPRSLASKAARKGLDVFFFFNTRSIIFCFLSLLGVLVHHDSNQKVLISDNARCCHM